MKGSEFQKEYLEMVRHSKGKRFLLDERSSALFQTMKQSYGIVRNKWNDPEKSRNIDTM
jgi:hypothetical protein